MALAIQIVSCLLWFPPLVLAISALLRVGVRRYPLIFVYLVVTFLVAAVQAPISFAYRLGNRLIGDWFQTLNSVAQSVTYSLILCVVLTFIFRATAHSETRRVARTAVLVGVSLLVLISFLVHYRANTAWGVWVTPLTRDLHFGAAILDLAAWGMLVASRRRDSRLLLLTGGMGIMFAGEAIGAALRSISIPYRSYPIFYSGHILKVLADATFLYIWWQTFRNEARERAAHSVVGTRG